MVCCSLLFVVCQKLIDRSRYVLMDAIHDELMVMIFELAGTAAYYPIVRTCWRWRRLFRKPMGWFDYIAHTASCGEMNIVKWAVNDGVHIDFPDFAPIAAYSGNIEFLEWICATPYVNNYNDPSGKAVGARILHCVLTGERHRGDKPNIELYDMARSRVNVLSLDFIVDVARHGNLELLQWLLSTTNLNPKYCSKLIGNIIHSNHLHLLQYLHNIGLYTYDDSFVNTAIIGGAKEVLEWFVSNGWNLPSHCVIAAIDENQYDIARWLVDKGYAIRNTAYSFAKYACDTNDMELLDWVLALTPDHTKLRVGCAQTPEQFDKMRAAGCRMDYINGLNLDDADCAIKMLAHTHGIMPIYEACKTKIAHSNNNAVKLWAISNRITSPNIIATPRNLDDFIGSIINK